MAAAGAKTFTHLQRVRLLYKTVLRLHRGLPLEFKAIGDQYVKEEFKRHKNCKPEEVSAFMTAWVDYAVTLTKQLSVKHIQRGDVELGRDLTPTELDLFRDEQISQLYELMQESTKPIVESEDAPPH